MYYYHSLDDMVLGTSNNTSYINTEFTQNIDYLEYVPPSTTRTHHLQDNTNLTNFIKYMNSNPDYVYHNKFLYMRLHNICWRRIFKNHKNIPELNPLAINWDKNSDITWLFGPKIEQPASSVPSYPFANAQQQSQQSQQTQQTVSLLLLLLLLPTQANAADAQAQESNVMIFRNESSLDDLDNAIEDGVEDDRMSVSSYESDSDSSSICLQFDQDFIPTSSAASRKDSTTSTSTTSTSVTSLMELAATAEATKEIKSILKQHHNKTNNNTNNSNSNNNNNNNVEKQGGREVYNQPNKSVSFNYIISTREIIDNIALDYSFLDRNCL